jgi:D-methionine transport system substrate-binding protein
MWDDFSPAMLELFAGSFWETLLMVGISGDLDASAVNTNYAIPAGLHPSRDAIAQESARSPYVNLIAVREQDKDKPWVARLVKAYQSEEVRKFVQVQFKGAVIPGF